MGHYNFIFDEDDNVVIYIDGACFNNGRPYAAAGLGVWFNHGHALNLAEPVNGWATNNAGEIQAATNAIYRAGDYGWDAIHIITDSRFLINAVTKWMYKWRNCGWTRTDGRPLANERDLQDLDDAMDAFPDMDIYWEHVFAHSGIEGNEEADYLAKEGARKYQNMWC